MPAAAPPAARRGRQLDLALAVLRLVGSVGVLSLGFTAVARRATSLSIQVAVVSVACQALASTLGEQRRRSTMSGHVAHFFDGGGAPGGGGGDRRSPAARKRARRLGVAAVRSLSGMCFAAAILFACLYLSRVWWVVDYDHRGALHRAAAALRSDAVLEFSRPPKSRADWTMRVRTADAVGNATAPAAAEALESPGMLRLAVPLPLLLSRHPAHVVASDDEAALRRELALKRHKPYLALGPDALYVAWPTLVDPARSAARKRRAAAEAAADGAEGGAEPQVPGGLPPRGMLWALASRHHGGGWLPKLRLQHVELKYRSPDDEHDAPTAFDLDDEPAAHHVVSEEDRLLGALVSLHLVLFCDAADGAPDEPAEDDDSEFIVLADTYRCTSQSAADALHAMGRSFALQAFFETNSHVPALYAVTLLGAFGGLLFCAVPWVLTLTLTLRISASVLHYARVHPLLDAGAPSSISVLDTFRIAVNWAPVAFLVVVMAFVPGIPAAPVVTAAAAAHGFWAFMALTLLIQTRALHDAIEARAPVVSAASPTAVKLEWKWRNIRTREMLTCRVAWRYAARGPGANFRHLRPVDMQMADDGVEAVVSVLDLRPDTRYSFRLRVYANGLRLAGHEAVVEAKTMPGLPPVVVRERAF